MSLVLLISGAISLWAGDSWREKPAAEWTAAECIKILNNSTWVGAWHPLKLTSNPANNNALREYERYREDRIDEWESQNPNQLGVYSIPMRTDRLRRAEREARRTALPRKNIPPLAFRWLSFSPMRDAIVRSKELAGHADTEDIRKFLSLARNYHMIAVGVEEWMESGAPLDFRKPSLTDSRIARITNSYLYLKPSDVRVAPVAVAQISFGYLEPDLVLFFPRQVEGKPLLTSKVKKAELIYFGHVAPLKVVFDLRKMMREAGRNH